jgi:hypothetical protein
MPEWVVVGEWQYDIEHDVYPGVIVSKESTGISSQVTADNEEEAKRLFYDKIRETNKDGEIIATHVYGPFILW